MLRAPMATCFCLYLTKCELQQIHKFYVTGQELITQLQASKPPLELSLTSTDPLLISSAFYIRLEGQHGKKS